MKKQKYLFSDKELFFGTLIVGMILGFLLAVIIK